jgi:hypothetical protein
MGMSSAFEEEDEIHIYDELFYEWCKSLKGKTFKDKYKRTGTYSTAGDVVKWYDDNRTNGKLEPFSFECFDDWKIQSYWYDEFCYVIKGMEKFMKDNKFDGRANFRYEEGHPFMFILDYSKKEIRVEYAPIMWETMNFNQYKPKIPKKILDKIKEIKLLEEL